MHLPPPDDLRLSNTTGILQKKETMWFIGVEVEKEIYSLVVHPFPKKNPGSAPDTPPFKTKSLGVTLLLNFDCYLSHRTCEMVVFQ